MNKNWNQTLFFITLYFLYFCLLFHFSFYKLLIDSGWICRKYLGPLLTSYPRHGEAVMMWSERTSVIQSCLPLAIPSTIWQLYCNRCCIWLLSPTSLLPQLAKASFLGVDLHTFVIALAFELVKGKLFFAHLYNAVGLVGHRSYLLLFKSKS